MHLDINISDQLISDTIISAFEGGSNYWFSEVAFFDRDYVYVHSLTEKPMENLGKIEITEGEGDGAEILTLQLMKKAFQVHPVQIYDGLVTMANKYAQHFGNMISLDGDAETGDVFLQCCLFGEIKYG